LKFEYFIAKRLVVDKSTKSSVSKPIVNIAVAAIAIGIIMMIVSVSTGLGLQQKIRQKVGALNGHIQITNFDDNFSEVSKNPISTDQIFYSDFKTVEGVNHVQAVATKAGIIRTEEAFEGVLLKGVGKDYRWNDFEEMLVEGNIPNVTEELNDQILISKFLSNRLQLNVGDTFSTYFIKDDTSQPPNLRVFRVVGIYDSGFQEFDVANILGDIRHIQRMNKWQEDQVGMFEIFIDDFSKIDLKTEEVYQNSFNSNNPEQVLDTISIKEKYNYIFEWLTLFDVNILVILIIMIIVATINMVVALLVLILEKTQMIGILKSLGASNWNIRKIFLINAVHIIVRGLLIGNVFAFITIFIQDRWGVVTLNPENYYVTVAPVLVDFPFLLLINLGTLLICLLVLIVPSYLITRISPISAIRFD
jgi:lipoprotein-releasing system permease protein